MIASMTGFARAAGTTGPVQWAWEVRSVNGRGLDVRLKVPNGYDAVGEVARTALQKTLARGQCQLSLSLTRPESAARVRIDEALLASLAQAVARVAVPEGIAPATMAVVVAGQVDRMRALTRAAEDCPARSPEAIRARLAASVAGLVEAGGLDPERLHQEAALLAARADVREELDRLRAHLASVADLLAAGGAVGRKLDFLAQELGREANTLCAKAGDITLSRIGLDLKAVVEQFREQVQNVE